MRLVLDADERYEAGYAYYRLGLERPGQNIQLRTELLQFLTLCEALVGNLAEAKRLATENYIDPTFRMQIAYHDGDWKAAVEMLEKILVQARSLGEWNELNGLAHGVDLRRATRDYVGAATDLKRAVSLYQADDMFWEARVRPQGVMIYFDLGEPEKAADHLEYRRKALIGGEDWLGRAGPIWVPKRS